MSPGLHPECALAILDPGRVEALASTRLLDSDPDPQFDRLTTLTARVAAAPVSLVALIDGDRSFFKSAFGVPEMPPGRSVPLSHSLCQHVVGQGAPLIIDDARTHPLVRDNGGVTDLGVGAYLGVPVRGSSGHVLGSLCAIDLEPRTWTEDDKAALLSLASSVESEITLREALEENRRSETRYRTLYEAAPEAILILDPATEEVLHANAAATALYGGSIEELIGLSMRTLSNDPAQGDARVRALAEGSPNERFESKQLRLDGTPIHVRISASHIEYEGRPALLSINRDITAQKTTEAALRQSEARLQLALKGGQMGTWALRLDTDRVVIDAQEATLLGLEPGVSSLDAVKETIHPEDWPGVEAAIQSAIDSSGDYAAEFRVLRPDGSHRWLAGRGRIVGRPGTAGYGLIGVNYDVTDAKEAERMLAESEARYRSVIDTVRDVVFQSDDGPSWTFLSPSWAEVSGYSVEESLGRPLTDFLHGSDADAYAAAVHAVLRGDTPFLREEVRLAAKDGEVRWVEIHAQALLDEAGQPTGITGSLTDITERVRFGAERKARKEAERMVALKDAFLSNMSHELRTPLTAIIGSADILVEELDSDLGEFAEAIKAGGHRLLDTLTAFMELSQIQVGEVEVMPRDTSLNPVLEAAVGAHRAHAERKGLELDLESDGPRVHADPRLLERVVSILVGNAVKFTERGRVSVRVQHDGERLSIEVADTGVGISEETLPYLFDEFQQSSQGHSRSHEGNGLGLSIAKGLLGLMEGRVSVESQEGHGSVFRVDVPAPLAESEDTEMEAVIAEVG